MARLKGNHATATAARCPISHGSAHLGPDSPLSTPSASPSARGNCRCQPRRLPLFQIFPDGLTQPTTNNSLAHHRHLPAGDAYSPANSAVTTTPRALLDYPEMPHPLSLYPSSSLLPALSSDGELLPRDLLGDGLAAPTNSQSSLHSCTRTVWIRCRSSPDIGPGNTRSCNSPR